MSTTGDFRKILKELEKHPSVKVIRKTNHYAVLVDGKQVTVLSGNKDSHHLVNSMANLRRAGVDIKWRGSRR